MSKRELAALQRANLEHTQYDLARRIIKAREFTQPGDILEVWVQFHPRTEEPVVHSGCSQLVQAFWCPFTTTVHDLVLRLRRYDDLWAYGCWTVPIFFFCGVTETE